MSISWDFLAELEEQHGDAFYVMDMRLFQDNYREFLEAFRRRYANTNIAYSYKTNYTPRICQSVNAMGGYAEVVSSMEYELALRIGVAPTRVIFNGPYKSATSIETALHAGSIVNLDSLHEVTIVETIAHRSPSQRFTVGLRCNFDIGAGGTSRFGFDVDGAEFGDALTRLLRLTNCCVGGLHCHFSTSARTVESYALRAKRMLELSAGCFKDQRPRFINIGGGYFSKMNAALQDQFAFTVPTYDDYAKAIAPEVAAAFDDASGPELILEPGSAIVADILRFVAKIVDIKRVRSRTVALTTGSVHNIKPTLHNKTMPVRVYSREHSKGVSGPVDIAGYTCMEHDILYAGYEGRIAVGDYVVFDNVGAYTIVMKPPFIKPAPAIVSYDPVSAAVDLIRRPETMTDVLATYCF